MSHLKKIIPKYKNWKKDAFKKNRPIMIISIFFIVSFLIFLLLSHFSKILPIKINTPTPPTSYLLNIFENEQIIKPPFDLTKIQQPLFPNKVCPITSYGAIGDSKNLNTTAFASAIKDCAKLGGGTVEVPAGQWLTGAIKLESNINLHLNKDAVIIFSNNPQDYLPAAFSRYEGVEYIGFSPFIYASNSQNIAITGQGKLNGQGSSWWPKNNMLATYALYDMGEQNTPIKDRVFTDENLMLRPSFVQFENCNSVLLEDFIIENSPMWTIHPLYSSNILIKNITINTSGLNTDGIAIDSSKNILIDGATITSGDDAIAIKAGRDLDGLRVNKSSENIIIRNCNIQEGHGGLAIGSETSGSIRNVFAYNQKNKIVNYNIRLKSSIGRGGIIENIWTSNFSANKISAACIQMITDYDQPRTVADIAIPIFKNIHFNGISCKRSADSINIKGIENNKIENVSFNNIEITSRNGASISNASNIEILNTSIKNSNAIPLAYNLSNTQNTSINGLNCPQMKNMCLEAK